MPYRFRRGDQFARNVGRQGFTRIERGVVTRVTMRGANLHVVFWDVNVPKTVNDLRSRTPDVIPSAGAEPMATVSQELCDEVLAVIPEIIFKRGMQVAYIPDHARNPNDRHDASHPDVQFGFVTSVGEDANIIYCRFWRKMERGERPDGWKWIRTKFNSEAVKASHLLNINRTTPQMIDAMLEYIDKEETSRKHP